VTADYQRVRLLWGRDAPKVPVFASYKQAVRPCAVAGWVDRCAQLLECDRRLGTKCRQL